LSKPKLTKSCRAVEEEEEEEDNSKIIEQVNLFNYLRNMISYEGELDIENKLNNFLKITGILNNVFRPRKNP